MADFKGKECRCRRTGFFLAAVLAFFVFAGAVLVSCQVSELRRGLPARGIRVASWNTQTFFDAVESGAEFAEFRGAKSAWNEEKYVGRLKRLCAVIGKLDADFIALQEIENEAVVRDIANMLPVTAGYRFAAFAKDEGDAFGCAVFSRFPIEAVKTHQLSERTEANPFSPPLRPLMEVRCKTEKKGASPLVFFVCHWKSKSGGAEKSEIWRERQESLLLETAQASLAPLSAAAENADGTGWGGKPELVAALGDFNRTSGEFSDAFTAAFTDGWSLFAGQSGSYFFRGEWERIDHIFVLSASRVRFAAFKTAADGPQAREGRPYLYRLFNGEGYSDHLPVSAVFAD